MEDLPPHTYVVQHAFLDQTADRYLVSHASDVLRFLLLWRYGGTYLDMDQIFVKALPTTVRNFVGKEGDIWVGEQLGGT